MPRLATLDEIARDFTMAPPVRPEITAALLRDPDPERRLLAQLWRAALVWRRDGDAAACAYLAAIRREHDCWPLPLLANLVWSARRCGAEPSAAAACLEFARQALDLRYTDLALEAFAAALMLDALGDYAITTDPAAARSEADAYERVAAAEPAPAPLPSRPRGGEPLRVALVVPNLVDYVVAYTQRVLHFARLADPARFQIAVYVSENHAPRAAPLFPVGCVAAGTAERGRRTLKELRRLGVPVWLTPTDMPYGASARLLAGRLEADGTDILVLQSGLSAPIDWLAARLARVPVKVSIHIGSTLYLRGFAAAFYDNPANLARETPWWPADAGERIVRPKGVDLEELDAQEPLARARLGLPETAVVIGTLSNHLERRLSDGYVDVIARMLRAHPTAWFAAFGGAAPARALARFAAAGVAQRVRFFGKQSQTGSVLKALDVYANEFPVGGSQSVMEACACGVPVVAAHWSAVHAESAGAAVVGPEQAVTGPDPDAYAQRLDELLRLPERRRAVGAALRRRAGIHFSARDYVAAVLDYAAARLPSGVMRGTPACV